jgi:N6-adenosine-specific RNA methylase IME4
LHLPVQELADPAGALLVLWITNREKLRRFIEVELLPSWGVKDPTEFYWLKVCNEYSCATFYVSTVIDTFSTFTKT